MDAQREKTFERTNPLIVNSQVLVKFGSLSLRRYTGTFHVFQVRWLHLILYYSYVYYVRTDTFTKHRYHVQFKGYTDDNKGAMLWDGRQRSEDPTDSQL